MVSSSYKAYDKRQHHSPEQCSEGFGLDVGDDDRVGLGHGAVEHAVEHGTAHHQDQFVGADELARVPHPELDIGVDLVVEQVLGARRVVLV